MARGVLLALVVAALGFGVWMVMGDSGGSAHDALDEVGRGADPATEATTGPTLIARGRAAPEDEVATGHPWGVSVLVLDVEGKPASDVRVTLRFSQPRYNPQSADRATRLAYGEWSRSRLRRMLDRRRSGDDDGELRAEGRTDATGRVRLETRGSGHFNVEALAEAPRGGDLTYIDVEAGKTPDEVTLRLVDLVEVEGRVIDTNGRGTVADVLPQSQTGSGMWRGERVSTDADGHFVVFAPVGPLVLSVYLGEQLSLLSRGHTAPSATPLEVVVPVLDSTLDVTVVDPMGAPIPGAVVQVSSEGAWQAFLLADTAADGVARFLAPAGSVIGISVEAEPWLSSQERAPLAEWAPLVLSAEKPASVRVTLMAGGVVSGVVRAGEGGPGLPGATVRALLGQGSPGAYGWNQPEATSDASGRYRLEGVPIGRHILYATHGEWFHPAVELATRGSAPPVDATIAMLEGGTELERDIVMQQGVVVSGIVVDANARPIPGARLMPGPDRNMELQTIWQWGVNAGNLSSGDLGASDAEGRFRLGRPPGSTLVLAALADDGASPFTDPIDIKKGSPVPEVRLVVEPGATVRGRVVRGDERVAVIGASVSTWSTDRKRYPSVQRQAKSDAEGCFELTGLAPVAFRLSASLSGAGGRVQKQLPAPQAGSTLDDVELVVSEGHTLTLILVDEQDGKPIEDQMFMLQGHQGGWGNGTTDAEGRATVENLEPGPYSVSLQGGDGVFEAGGRAITVPSAEPVTVRMRRRKQNVVEGRVLMPDGTPVPLCNVAVSQPQGLGRNRVTPMGWGGGGGTLAIGGRFRVLVTFDPPYHIDVSRPCDADGRPLDLRAPDSNVSAEDVAAGPIVVRLEQSGQVLVRILGDDDQPPKSAWINLGSPGGGMTQVPADGRVRLDGLPVEGTVTLFINAPGYRNRSEGYEVPVGDNETIVRLERGGTIEGRVDWGDDAPLQVTVSSNWNVDGKSGWAYTQVEDDGRFVLGGLPDGAAITLQLGIMRTSQAGQARMGVSVADVRVGTRDLVIRAGGGLPLRGRVVDGAGRGVSGAQIQVTDSAKQNAQLVTGADGGFEIEGLAPGEAELRAWRGDQHNLATRDKVQAGSRNVEVRLLEPRNLRGTVIGEAASLKNLSVRALSKASPKDVSRHGQVQADGTFSIPVPDDGARYDLWVLGMGATHYGHAPDVDGRSDVRIRLVPGSTIDGRVDGVDDEDVKHLWIRARNDAGLSTYSRLKEDRTWTLSGLPEGPWTLTLGGRGGYKTEPMEGVANGTSGFVVRASR